MHYACAVVKLYVARKMAKRVQNDMFHGIGHMEKL